VFDFELQLLLFKTYGKQRMHLFDEMGVRISNLIYMIMVLGFVDPTLVILAVGFSPCVFDTWKQEIKEHKCFHHYETTIMKSLVFLMTHHILLLFLFEKFCSQVF
jgi:hypothetical protein